ARKRRERGMRGSADEIDRSVAQRHIAFINRIDQLEGDIEAFLLETAQLDGGDGGKIRVRDHVGGGEFHISNSGVPRFISVKSGDRRKTKAPLSPGRTGRG